MESFSGDDLIVNPVTSASAADRVNVADRR